MDFTLGLESVFDADQHHRQKTVGELFYGRHLSSDLITSFHSLDLSPVRKQQQ